MNQRTTVALLFALSLVACKGDYYATDNPKPTLNWILTGTSDTATVYPASDGSLPPDLDREKEYGVALAGKVPQKSTGITHMQLWAHYTGCPGGVDGTGGELSFSEETLHNRGNSTSFPTTDLLTVRLKLNELHCVGGPVVKYNGGKVIFTGEALNGFDQAGTSSAPILSLEGK